MNGLLLFFLNIWYVTGFFFYLIYGYWSFWRTDRIRKKKGDQAADEFLRPRAEKFGRRAFTWLMMRPEIHGLDHLPKDRSFLLVCNHQSYFDIPLIMGFIEPRASFIGKKEVQSLPLMGRGLSSLGGVFIDRENPQQAVGALRKVISGLQVGKIFALFPEGTRSSDGKLGSFKKGSLRMGLMAKVPIFPVVIQGTKDVVSKGNLFIHPAKVSVHILEEILPSNFANEEELIRVVHQAIKKRLPNQPEGEID